MQNRKTFWSIGIFIVIAIIFIVTYRIYSEPKTVSVENPLPEPEAVLPVAQEQNLNQRDSIVEYAIDFLGTPYVTAGSDRDGFDCSGFVFYVYSHFDIKVPRSTANFENFGEEIPLKEVKKGDLLLFLSPTRNAIGHIGIITEAKGKESDFIHATSGSAMSVVITSLLNEGYTRRFVKAVRVI